MFLVHNERTKLMANWFNTLAAALLTAGVFAPVAALFCRVSQGPQDSLRLVLATSAYIAGGAFLHWL
ncbi:MAG: hypothetical protein WC670_04385 [Pseudolabrys sp.]|jgi:hypothetical protein